MTPPIPPEPTTTVFTYETAREFTIDGSFPAVYYSSIRLGSVDCKVDYVSSNQQTYSVPDLVIYTDALGATRFYLARGAYNEFSGFLDENFELGTTSTMYTLVNGVVTTSSARAVLDCTPSDYVSILRSLDFELQQRS